MTDADHPREDRTPAGPPPAHDHNQDPPVRPATTADPEADNGPAPRADQPVPAPPVGEGPATRRNPASTVRATPTAPVPEHGRPADLADDEAAAHPPADEGPAPGDDEPTVVAAPRPHGGTERDLGGDTVPLGRPADAGREPGDETVRLSPAGEAQRAHWNTGTAAWDFLAAERERAGRDRAAPERTDRHQAGQEQTAQERSAGEPGHRERAGRPAGERELGGGDSGSPETVTAAEGGEPVDRRDAALVPKTDLDLRGGGKRTVSSASALIGVLLALFGFTLVVQLRSNDTDQGLATARQEDLVRILSDLEARDTRLSGEISALEQSQRQLTSGVAGRQAALAEADKRADELGLLAGTLPGRGPGLKIVIDPKSGQVKASAVLNAVQELRGAGGEVMEVVGSDGTAVRIVASTYFVDAGGGGLVVDGAKLTGPYTLWVIGSPQTMQTALQIPGGVVASVESAGGSVTMEQSSLVEVAAVRKAANLQYARPVS